MNLRHLLRRHNNPISIILRLTTTPPPTPFLTPTLITTPSLPRLNHTFLKPFHSSTATAIKQTEDDDNAAMNEFLSRFVHSMRSKLTDAYPDTDKNTMDSMLVLVVDKLVSEMDIKGGYFDGNFSDTTNGFDNQDLTKTMWEVSNTVFHEMEKEKKKEKLNKFLQCEEVKTLARFASEAGVRGDLLRELRFKWAREAMEDAEFYADLNQLKEQDADNVVESGSGESGIKEEGLPKRKGKISYNLYGLDLSGEKWREVSEKVHEEEKFVWATEPKEITGKCKLVTDKIVGLMMDEDQGYVSDLFKDWVELLDPSKVDWFALLDNVKTRDYSVYLKMAERVLDEPTFQPDIRDYSILIDIHAKENRTEDVARLLKKMSEKGLPPDVLTLTTLLHLYSKANNLDQAKEAYEALRNQGFKPDKQIYNSMIMAYVNAGQPKLAEAVMREMELRDIKPSEEISMSLLQAFAQRGDISGAQRIVTTMQFTGFQPTPESCTLLIQASAKSGKPTDARNNFEYMMKLGYKPDDRSTSMLISAYERKNELDKALSLLLQLEKDGFEPGVSTYCVLVDWLGKLQLIDEAEQMLAKIAQLGEAPPFKLQVSLFDMYSRSAIEAKKDLLEYEKKALQTPEVLEARKVLHIYEKKGPQSPEVLEARNDLLEYEKKALQTPEVLEAKKVHLVYEKKALQTLGVLEAKKDLLEHEDFERIIQGLMKGGFMNDADRIQKLMEAQGFTPSDSFNVSKLAMEAFRGSGTSNRPGMR